MEKLSTQVIRKRTFENPRTLALTSTSTHFTVIADGINRGTYPKIALEDASVLGHHYQVDSDQLLFSVRGYNARVIESTEITINGVDKSALDMVQLFALLKDNVFFTASAGGTLPYKVYTALLSQSGTDAPVATVLQNTLGGDVVWVRLSAGNYEGELIGAFPVSKTHFSITTGEIDRQIGMTPFSPPNSIGISTAYWDTNQFIPFDNMLGNTPIKIEVYP